MTLQELQTQLHALTPIERANALQILTQGLSSHSQGIVKRLDVMGGDACIANTRLPVWLFVSLRTQGATDADLLKAYSHLTAADLVNVWAYADAHPEEIAIALQEQENAMQEDG
ncbi:DUF433 domain-containing protein [Pseudanabaenaceae cyanobacterium LEGE 13415]|nr:DUF433 domain-containing protein [Pseudanabaenaceae cyanobacterium LEGE 13415]